MVSCQPIAGFQVTISSAEALRTLGEHLAGELFVGAVVLLEGSLGAGKTTFAQGVARGLGVSGTVASPTYAIIHEYPAARIPLCHADMYRVESQSEWNALAMDERVGIEGVWLIEWASRFPDAWPRDRLVVTITDAGDLRTVRLSVFGPLHLRILTALNKD